VAADAAPGVEALPAAIAVEEAFPAAEAAAEAFPVADAASPGDKAIPAGAEATVEDKLTRVDAATLAGRLIRVGVAVDRRTRADAVTLGGRLMRAGVVITAAGAVRCMPGGVETTAGEPTPVVDAVTMAGAVTMAVAVITADGGTMEVGIIAASASV